MGTGIDNTLLLRTKFVEPDTGVLTRNGVLYLQSLPGVSAIAELQLLGNLDDSFTAASLARSQPKILFGTNAARIATYPAVAFPLGTIFYETDRVAWYQVQTVSAVNTWVYVGGNGYQRTQSQLAALTALLTTNDALFVAYVTDYGHQLQWSGTAWGWAPGDAGSGAMQLFEVDPTGVGWHLYDGSAVSYLKSDGTLGSTTLPDLTSIAANAAFTVAGSPNGGPNAAVKTTLTTTTGNVLAGAGASSTFLTSVVTNVEGTPRDIVRRPWFRQ